MILPAMAGLDRWLSRQNPAYRPVLHKKHRQKAVPKKEQSSVWRGHTEDFSLILFHQLIENDNSGDYLKQQISAEAK